LDLFVVSRELRPFVSQLEIDQGRLFTPARVVKKKGQAKLVYSDHFACMLTFTSLARVKEEQEEKRMVWNLRKEGGWSLYKEVTDSYSEKVSNIAENMELNIEEMSEAIEKVNNKIKFKAFGKVTIGVKKKDNKSTEQDKNKNEDAETILNEQVKRAKEEIDKMKSMQNGRVGKVWDVRKKILGEKKSTMEATAIKHPITNKLLVSKTEIKEATLDYCQKTLANNVPEKDFKAVVEDKKEEVKKKMNEKNGRFETDINTFEEIVSKFKKSGKKNYDFITKAGKKYQQAIFLVCERMIKEETFPISFRGTILHMIFKGGKGKREMLPDNRFIHSKSWMPRLVEALVVQGGLKGPLVDSSSIYQIGGQAGHRAEEMIFTMKSVIAKQRAEKKPVLLQLYDLEKYFDKEMMEDAVVTSYNRGADPKAIRCWYKLNRETQIKVRTGAGMSGSRNVGAVVGQGTIGGALVSQAVLDDGVQEHFEPGGQGELRYGDVLMAPVLFQDDILHGVPDLEAAREGNRKMNLMVKQRALKWNSKKTLCIMIGTKNQKKTFSKNIKEIPLMCGETEMKEAQTDKWLGQQISAKGLSDSVLKTIEAKEGKIKAACLEIAAVVEDWRSQVVGGMESALTMWEACCVPSLLYGAGTWVEITPAAERRLEALQNWFVRLILRVGPGCPKASLRWETGLMSMALRVWLEKVLMVRHLRGLDADSLARRVYEEQREKAWPGLAKETADICRQLGIPDCNTADIFATGNKEYRKIITEKCKQFDKRNLEKEMEGKEKCEKILMEGYGKKKYLTENILKKIRKIFLTRVKLQPFGGNYKHDKKFEKTNWMCFCGWNLEEESHLLSGQCPVYGDMVGMVRDRGDDEQLSTFFAAVLERREKLEQQPSSPVVARPATDIASP